MAEQKPKKQNEPEPKAQETETEGGFGTGLRAQLQRRQEPAGDGALMPPQETPIVRVDLYAAAPASVSTNGGSASEGAHPDLDHLRAELAAALAREQDLRQALGEQVEAYERKLSDDHLAAKQAAELDDHGARLAQIEEDVAQRERALAAERKALEEERRRGATCPAERLRARARSRATRARAA